MSHSVVKVTDSIESDSLLLLVGEDGTVTPDKETVKSFLNSKTGSTNIQLMHINKSDGKSIDVSIDNLMYVPDNDVQEVVVKPSESERDMDQLAHHLYCIRLDHDYTPLTSPKRPDPPSMDDDLAHTLGILDGTIDTDPPELVIPSTPIKTPTKIVKTIPKQITLRPLSIPSTPVPSPVQTPVQTLHITPTQSPVSTPVETPVTTPLKTPLATPFSSPVASVAKQQTVTVAKPPTATVAKLPAATVAKPAAATVAKPPAATLAKPPAATVAKPPVATVTKPLTAAVAKPAAKLPAAVSTITSIPSQAVSTPTSVKTKPKVITLQKRTKSSRQVRAKPKIVEEIEEEEEDEEEVEDDDDDDDDDADFDNLHELDFDYLDDENDSDFEIEEAQKQRVSRKPKRKPKKPETPKSVKATKAATPKLKMEKQQEPEPEPPKVEKQPLQPPAEQKPPQTAEQKAPEKKPPKKEKKPPKPIPDDFALFSTPDIIRRVGGKEPTTSNVPATPVVGSSPTSSAENASVKPAKITQENRSKSTPENTQSPPKPNRLSLDSKVANSEKEKHTSSHHRSNSESKHKDRRPSSDSRVKRHSIDENKMHKHPEKSHPEHRKSTEHKNSMSSHSSHHSSNSDATDNIGSISTADLNDIMMNDSKSFPTALPMDVTSDLNASEHQSLDQSNLNLESSSLELDPTLLDNINNDLISEDILYQVAQSLVNNTDLQNAIDKSINEGNLVLDPAIQQAMQDQNSAIQPDSLQIQKQISPEVHQHGTQIVRPDGRIVVIPPIERPTTRSRNKKKEDEKPVFKTTYKPLDEEHVSGNELDTSGEEEDESEDDPNKLWCICNRPHNNRFMICCDTCEEWYHGKCVNITKSMGQQMEAEGKEWICLFCKDSSLKRPQAAARRIRKASRASRASSDSTGSSKKGSSDSGNTGSLKCVVCPKPARKSSIYCSEACILAHAQGVEKVVVFERATGKMLSGNAAPTATNLERWLSDHPGFEVVRSTGKLVTTKTPQLTQSKLKVVKNQNNEGVSLSIQKKGVSVGVLKHTPKNQHSQLQHHHQSKLPVKGQITGVKIISKQINTAQQKTAKLVHPQTLPVPKTPTSPVQTTPKAKQQVKTQKTIISEKKSTPLKEKPSPKDTSKEKPMPAKTPKIRQAESTPLPKQQENIRENVQKTLLEQLTNRMKMVDDLKVSEEDLKNISNEIESQLFKCFGDTGQKYRNKYRSLIFNIKDVKNQTLWRRICEKSVNPYQLVRLSSDDLASQELALWREREAKHQLDMIKKSELELLNCNRQYVLKTHKGEQVLEDNRPTDRIESTDIITSLTEGTKSDTSETKHESKDRDKRSSSKHRHKDRDRERKLSKDKSDVRDSRSHRSSSHDRERDRSRRRSRSRDRSSRHKKRSRSKEKDRHRHSSHKSSKHKKDSHSSSANSTTDKLDKKSKEILEQLVDSKIVPPLEDRLWKHVPQDDIMPASMESDSDHEPSSTVTIPTPPRPSDQDDFSIDAKPGEGEEERSTSPPLRRHPEEIWRGTISMIDVAQICITAHEVSGDCSGLGTELPPNLEIVGRISPDTVWDYIRKMRCSNSKIISLVRLNAINIEEKMPYLALYSYLSSRNRLGVVKSVNKAVKDFYILPLASQKPIPQALLPLSGPGFEESRPALLLGIIVRDKRKRPLVDPAPAVTPPKRARAETPPLPTPALPAQPVPAPRSYTPPPSKDPRMKLPLPPVLVPVPPVVAADDEPVIKGDEDEPYSPEDSDPDSSTLTADISIVTPSVSSTKYNDPGTPPRPFPTYTPKIQPVPGLDVAGSLSATTHDLETHLAELNKKIAESKSQINSISQNIASTEIGSTALASIALPSNLQQILDSINSIKTIVPTEESEVVPGPSEPLKDTTEGNLTIPLMLPNKFTRPLNAPPVIDLGSDTIPLNLPKVKKTSRVNSPLPGETEKISVLSSLTEEDLIRKAAEMLGEDSTGGTTESKIPIPDTDELGLSGSLGSRPTIVKTLQPDSHGPRRPKMDLSQPPIPGLESEMM